MPIRDLAVKRLEDIPKLHDEIDRLETDVARLTEENARLREAVARLRALIVDAGYIIGSLRSHAPGNGVTDASTDQCWCCGERWPCPTAQWRDATSEEVDRG
jgi:hypothetical protein